MRRVVVVRHGNTFADGEEPRRIGARSDPPLTERGREQGAALGAAFARAGWRFGRVLAGPARRARDTAAAAGHAPAVAHWLGEVDHGPDEGRPDSAVAARLGRSALAAWDQEAAAPPGWHVFAEARIAVWRGVLLARHEGDALLFTSSGTARYALVATGGQPAKLRTGAYGVFEDGRPVAWDVRPGEDT